jgi:DNA-binding transcriptional regulator YiaG
MNKHDPNIFGRFLNQLRQGANLEIEEATRKLGCNGTKQLRAWEAGEEIPAKFFLQPISVIYRIPYNELKEIWDFEQKMRDAKD